MKDLTDLLDPTLRLPIRGKVYAIPAPPGAVGVRLTLGYTLGLTPPDQITPEQTAFLTEQAGRTAQDASRDILGDVYDEMIADGLPLQYIEHAETTALIAWVIGQESAEAYWETGGKATPPASTAGTPTSTDAAPTTTAPASTSGTKSRRKPAVKKPTKRAVSPSGNSSPPTGANSSPTSTPSTA